MKRYCDISLVRQENAREMHKIGYKKIKKNFNFAYKFWFMSLTFVIYAAAETANFFVLRI